MNLRSCVIPPGCFRYGVHKPRYRVRNQREKDYVTSLGTATNGSDCRNHANFPSASVEVEQADTIFEINNPFPFRGTTYITKSWADEKADDPDLIQLPAPSPVSFHQFIRQLQEKGLPNNTPEETILALLPEQMLLALAVTSTDPEDLVCLARLSCDFDWKKQAGEPGGLRFKKTTDGKIRPLIHNPVLFEALANNPCLPDNYKEIMVLRPGIQGGSEIVGEWRSPEGASHVFEYLRRNSYIPWGHYAANMADDAIRYRIHDLTLDDITGMRHLYYQRTYIRMGQQLRLPLPPQRKAISITELEALRIAIRSAISEKKTAEAPLFNATLWGWNFGFDFSPSHYRLHASHQQIHQQFALIPQSTIMEDASAPSHESTEAGYPTYSCGDLLQDVVAVYRKRYQRNFFSDYFQAMRTNRRFDGRADRESSLIIHEDNNILLFVPKAQTAQWEIQIVTLMPIGNILEANTSVRKSIDYGMFMAMKILSRMGAAMITTIEYSRRFDPPDPDFHLVYAFLPKMPESPGAFSESQLRWINGHYPEDFAAACRRAWRMVPEAHHL
ncbi:MAG: hypothetical protein ACOZF0_06335 [Thermodesulfobacteriota bacterium]